MTEMEIFRCNQKMLRDLGERAALYDLKSYRQGCSIEKLLGWLREEPEEETKSYDAEGRLMTREDWLCIRKNRNIEFAETQTSCVVPVRWGVCTCRGSLRRLPWKQAVRRIPEDEYFDLLQQSAVLQGEPLLLLWESLDRQFYYALCAYGRGWISTAEVGLCPAEELWTFQGEKSAFLTVTGSRLRLSDCPDLPEISGRELTMGTRLPLAAPPGTIDRLGERMSYDNYIVCLPVREADGRLRMCPALLPVSGDACLGFLPYSPETLVSLAEKLRGEVYGWGGLLNSWDCSGLIMEIHRCFGLQLPRDSAALAQLPGIAVGDCSLREKRALLRSCPRGTILYFPGHVMLYTGEEGGEPCCISAAGNFWPAGAAGGEECRRVNTIVKTSLEVVRSNGRSWLQSLEKLICLDGI